MSIELARSGAVFGLLLVTVAAPVARAQDLVPGAQTPAPVGFNVVTIAASINDGDVAFDPSLPVEKVRASLAATILGFSRTLSVAGRFANIGVGLPFVFGHLEGQVGGQFQEVSRRDRATWRYASPSICSVHRP